MAGYRKRLRRRQRIPMVLLIFLIVLIILCLLHGFFHDHGQSDDNGILSHLSSTHAVLIDYETGSIVAEKEGDTICYPASLTKIMTVYTALQYLGNLDTIIYLYPEVFEPLYEQDASLAGFLPGESVSLRDLLYGAILPSGAECCQVLAYYVAGSEEAFCALMNEEASLLGLADTHFVNATGLHDTQHVSTAENLAKLLHVALQNETFYQIFTCFYYTTDSTNEHPNGLDFSSTLTTAISDLETNSMNTGFILGGKTGYTRQAGQCLATLADINGHRYILVTTHAPGNHNTAPYHLLDHLTVYQKLQTNE